MSLPLNPLCWPAPEAVDLATIRDWHRREARGVFGVRPSAVQADDQRRMAGAIDDLIAGRAGAVVEVLREAVRLHRDESRAWPAGWGDTPRGRFHAAAARVLTAASVQALGRAA